MIYDTLPHATVSADITKFSYLQYANWAKKHSSCMSNDGTDLRVYRSERANPRRTIISREEDRHQKEQIGMDIQVIEGHGNDLLDQANSCETLQQNPTPKEAGRLKEWSNTLEPYHSLSRAEAFACVAMIESGTLNIDPSTLCKVMAMSAGDSIYVAPESLCDPGNSEECHKLKKIFGNIGRSGLAMLIPPQELKTRKVDIRSWDVVNHTPFDGVLDDHFQGTSLHLEFSGYEVPLNVGEHGGRFTEAFFIEAIVSVHDQGQSLADLDISPLFPERRYFNFLVVDCKNQGNCRSNDVDPSVWKDYTSIESWAELLDPPCGAAVVRAHGNWQARLATALISKSMERDTVVVQCLQCCFAFMNDPESFEHYPEYPLLLIL